VVDDEFRIYDDTKYGVHCEVEEALVMQWITFSEHKDQAKGSTMLRDSYQLSSDSSEGSESPSRRRRPCLLVPWRFRNGSF
jgi:hypothetical protein